MIAPPIASKREAAMRGAALGLIVAVVVVTLAGCQQKEASSAVTFAAREASGSSPANEARDALAYGVCSRFAR